ncbi:MAG TPA: hypothetical protein VHY58_13175 [Streptosporangiaceae bacterium]|jgi:hypothetical protein|nr:hypothetical protein [Streptosporangiaceae bacterium]
MRTAASGGLSLLGGIEIIVILAVVAFALIMIYWRFRRPKWRARRVPWYARRDRRMQEAAAADAAALLGDAKYVRPDAPGDHLDDL